MDAPRDGASALGVSRDHANLIRMAWEWVAPVTTGVVGVAAGLFAWLGARTGANTQVRLVHEQHAHDREMQLRAERRDIFASFMTAIDIMDRRLAAAGKSLDGTPVDPESPEGGPEVRAMSEALEDLVERAQTVALVGSRATGTTAINIAKNAVQRSGEVASKEGWRLLDARITGQLIMAMRADLGIA